MQETETVSEPRDQIATMASDWEWIKRTLIMCADRALTGTPLHLSRPKGIPKHWDLVDLYRRNAHNAIDNIFSTAVVDEPEQSKCR